MSDSVQKLEDELKIALMYIQSTKDQILDARLGNGDLHQAVLDMIRNSPIIHNNRILLSDENKTYLELTRNHDA